MVWKPAKTSKRVQISEQTNQYLTLGTRSGEKRVLSLSTASWQLLFGSQNIQHLHLILRHSFDVLRANPGLF